MAVHEPELDRSARRFGGTAVRILLLGGVLAVLGLLLYLLGTQLGDVLEAAGAWLMYLAVPPTVIGLILLGIGGVSRRASRGKPFA